MEWKDKKDDLYRLIVIEKKSYEEIGKLFGCTGNNIKKVAKRLEIELEQRRKVNPKEHFNKKEEKNYNTCQFCGCLFETDNKKQKFCSKQCAANNLHKIRYEKIINGDESIMRANFSLKYFKKDIIDEQNGKCAICGMDEIWNGKKLVFIIDHIDGHASNNHRNNLRCICPNCDSQLDTYKSKNKNGDRYYYRYRYKLL